MNNSMIRINMPENEEVLSYAQNSKERLEIESELKRQSTSVVEIPIIINGEEIYTNDIKEIRAPHNKELLLGKFHSAGEKETKLAIKASLDAREEWSNLAWEERASIFIKAAHILSTVDRAKVNAATMLGQSKTVHQAEIDSACELIDFWNYNAYFLNQIYSDQPKSAKGTWNRLEYRALEGFIYAVTPFNFTSIAGNLPSAPAQMGNTVIWKPSKTSVLSSYYIFKILEKAGLPKGVINFVPGNSQSISNQIFSDRNFAGVHFTGSTQVFKSMWKTIGQNISNYRYYPRIVGETGGKDYIFACPDCELDSLVTATIRGAFEFQGQKCSAASRMYVAKSIFNEFRTKLTKELETVKYGDITNFSNFMGAVIDQSAFNNIKSYIDYAKDNSNSEILYGGTCNDSVGYFIEPTVILTSDPEFKTMKEEIFGPVLTIFVYDDKDFEETISIVNNSNDYALTGAIFSSNRKTINYLTNRLKDSAGNFYINDKPTGAVVGQQPFGGARASGTNDKAGSYLNLLRWVSARNIKETFIPSKDYRYPFMG